MAISLLVAGQSAASISWKPSRDMGELALPSLFLTVTQVRVLVHVVPAVLMSQVECGTRIPMHQWSL